MRPALLLLVTGCIGPGVWIDKAGDGNGTVTVEPVGIACGDVCAAVVDDGVAITLAAMPDVGSTFVGWTGGGCTGADPCKVVPSEDIHVTATFASKPRVPLTVTLAGTGAGTVWSSTAGIACPADCIDEPWQGMEVTLTATAASRSSFVGWSGACQGIETCVTTLDAATTVIATFDRLPRPACTSVVAASEQSGNFNARLTSGAVVCLEDGVTITGPVVLGGDDVTIRAVSPDDTATIRNLGGTAIDVAGKTGLVLENLVIESPGRSTSTILARGGSVTVLASELRCELDGALIAAYAGSAVTIRDSALRGGMTTQSFNSGVYVSGDATLDMADSTIETYGLAVWVATGADAVVERSHIHGYGTNVNPLLGVAYNATLKLARSHVLTTERLLLSASGTPAVTVTLDDNKFHQAEGQAATRVSPFQSEYGSRFMSTQPNTFCNEGTSTTDRELVLPLIAGAYAAESTFGSIAHVGPMNCPPAH